MKRQRLKKAAGAMTVGLLSFALTAAAVPAKALAADSGVLAQADGTAEAQALGDIDGDNSVGATDALLVLRQVVKLAELTPAQTAAADTDGNGSVEASDALCILRYVVNLISYFPAEAEQQAAASWEIIQKYGFAANDWGYGPDETYSILSYDLDLNTIRDCGSYYTVEATFRKPIYVSEETLQSGHFTVTTNELTGETQTFDLNDPYVYLVDGMLYEESYDRVDCIFYRGILRVNKDAVVGYPITSSYWSLEDGCWLEWANGVSFDENGRVTSLLSFGD